MSYGDIYVAQVAQVADMAQTVKAFQEAVQVVYDQCVEEGIMTADELKEMQDIVRLSEH